MASLASSVPVSSSTPSSEAPLVGDHTESNDESDRTEEGVKTDKQNSKRRLFGLLKKKNSDKGTKAEADASQSSTTSAPKDTPTAGSPQRTPPLAASQLPGSPQSMRSAAVSPHRHIRSPSPGLHSPASSLIFERNVQEQPLPEDLSAAIPHHIQTEDHIPAVLEASSLAITDDHLNPDEVEIVMHAAHQPASMAVAGEHQETTSGTLSPISTQEMHGISPLQDTEETATGYGALDTADIRRLSFISFADVVQSEHVEANNKESGLHMSFSAANRSPSPMRSPASSHGFGTSPPTSGTPSVQGMDLSGISNPLRLPGSPVGHGQSPPTGGELMVETMRQAVRKTASGDLSGARSPSQPLSAVSLEDTYADHPPFGK
jgi:hypothetical protein